MSEAQTLWVESYQGEVLGETIFGLMAGRESDPGRRHQLEVLTVLERATKELAEPVFDHLGFDRGDTPGTVSQGTAVVEVTTGWPWEQFVASILPITEEFLVKYRRLVELAQEDWERDIARAYVAHEEALASYARRALGQEEGDPLEPVLALPHVQAAAAA